MSELATPILDGNGSLTAVATFPLTNGDRSVGVTILQGDTPVSGGTPLPIGGTVAISGGAITVSNLPGTQLVSGAVTVSGSVGVTGPLPAGTNSIGTVVASGSVTVNSGTVSLTGALPAGANAIGTVVAGGTLAINNFPATQTVAGALTFGGALPAGTNNIGTVVAGGTLSIGTALPAGANNIGTVVASIGNSGTVLATILPLTSTNLSSTIAVTNTFQSIQVSTPGRNGGTIQNLGANLMWVHFGPIGSATKTNSVQLASGQSVSCAVGAAGVLTDQLSITGTAADAFFAMVQ